MSDTKIYKHFRKPLETCRTNMDTAGGPREAKEKLECGQKQTRDREKNSAKRVKVRVRRRRKKKKKRVIRKGGAKRKEQSIQWESN